MHLSRLLLLKPIYNSDKFNILKKNKAAILILSTLYFGLIVYYYKFYGELIVPDGISYLSFAKKYASALFYEAVSPYWSPLFSAIIAVFIKLGLSGLHAAKIVLIISGFLVLNITVKIIKENTNFWFSFLAGICMIPYIVYSALKFVNPDLLSVYLLLLYVKLYPQEPDEANYRRIIVLSLIGACCYFAKYYNLTFILVFNGIMLLFFILKKRFTGRSVQLFMTNILLTLLFCGPWIALISIKNNSFTISSAKDYNKQIVYSYFSENRKQEVTVTGKGNFFSSVFSIELKRDIPAKHPFFSNGIIDLKDSTLVSFWEKPLSTQENVKIDQSIQTIDLYLKILKYNVLSFILILLNQTFIIPIFLCIALVFFKKDILFQNFKYWLALAAYPIFYFLFFFEIRYIWFTLVLIFILAIMYTDYIKNRFLKLALFISVLLIMIWKPIMLLEKNKWGNYFVKKVIENTNNRFNLQGKRLASSPSMFYFSLCMAYFYDGQYLGIPKNAKELADYNIDYYLSKDPLPLFDSHENCSEHLINDFDFPYYVYQIE